MIELNQEHDWHEYDWPKKKFSACKKCGFIKRADGKNKPCKGVVKVGLRER